MLLTRKECLSRRSTKSTKEPFHGTRYVFSNYGWALRRQHADLFSHVSYSFWGYAHVDMLKRCHVKSSKAFQSKKFRIYFSSLADKYDRDSWRQTSFWTIPFSPRKVSPIQEGIHPPPFSVGLLTFFNDRGLYTCESSRKVPWFRQRKIKSAVLRKSKLIEQNDYHYN